MVWSSSAMPGEILDMDGDVEGRGQIAQAPEGARLRHPGRRIEHVILQPGRDLVVERLDLAHSSRNAKTPRQMA